MAKWLTQDEAEDYLGVSRTTLYRWRKDGRLKAYRAGNVVRYKQEDLDAALEADEMVVSDDAEE